MTQLLSVDGTKCTECGACTAECVCHWVASGSHLAATGHKHVDHASPYCTHCLHCYAVCPVGAIQLPGEYTALAQPDAWRGIGPEALESLLAQRRSTRRFQQRPVPRELIAQVVAAGRHIPSGGNRHAYEFTVLTDPAVKEALLSEFSRYYDRIRRRIGSAFIRAVGSLFKGLNASKQCKALVGMAPSNEVHAVVLLGYPDMTYRRPAPRPDKTVHWVS